MNWWAITIIFMWICAAIGTFFIKSDSPFGVALIGTIVIAILICKLR